MINIKKYLPKCNNKYVRANSVKPLYFISNKTNEYIEEKKSMKSYGTKLEILLDQ